MGADFIYAICEIGVPRETAEERINNLSDDQISQLWEDQFQLDEDCDLKQDALSCLDAIYGNYRDVGEAYLHGRRYVLSGGLSWGDDPTDSMAAISKIDLLGVTLPDEEWGHYKLLIDNLHQDKEGEE